jgi:NAD(P)-dependent dehydrogenase (short-subunit alcohol dehydrogenase family)
MIERKPRLAGKVAIVTGAGSRGPGLGNGRATAILFAREGARVILVDLYPERTAETLKVITSEGGQASALAADVTKLADCEAMVSEAVKIYGRLDILHNNVGIDSTGTIVEIDLREWEHVMEVNLKSVVLASRASIPQMRANGGGAIINISSVADLRPRNMDAYTTSKGAVISLTQSMAFSHAAAHIRVNCILPGPVYTPMVSGEMSPKTREGRRLSVPLQTEGTAWDVAWAAVYLASDEAKWVTGVSLPVDGGALLTRRLWQTAVD